MSKPKRKDIRTTVSMAPVVWEWAQEMMESKGFNDNFSAYVADLIRRDKEKEQERSAYKIVKGPSRLNEPGHSKPIPGGKLPGE